MIFLRKHIAFVLIFSTAIGFSQTKPDKTDSLWNIVKTTKSVVKKAKAYVELSELLGDDYLDTIPFFCNKAIYLLEGGKYSYVNELSDEINYTLGFAYNNLGVYTGRKQSNSKALAYFVKSVNYYRLSHNEIRKIESMQNLGIVYSRSGDYKKALECYDEALDLAEKNKSDFYIASISSSIGDLNYNIGEYQTSIKYTEKAYAISKEKHLLKPYIKAINNLAMASVKLGKYDEAMKYYFEALGLAIQLKSTKLEATFYNNIGDVHNKLKNKDSAKFYLEKSIALREKNNDSPKELTTVYNNLSRLLADQHNFEESAKAAEKAYKYAEEADLLIDKYQAMQVLSIDYEKLGDYKKAYLAYVKYTRLKDSSLSEINKRALIKREYDIEMEKRDFEAKLNEERLKMENKERLNRSELEFTFKQEEQKLNLLQEKREMMINESVKRKQMENEFNQQRQLAEMMKQKDEIKVSEERKRQNTIIISISALFVFLAVFSYLLYRRFQVTKKQKDLIDKQREEVLVQKHIVEEKNKEIFDSITYAKRLQGAIMPPKSYIEKYFPYSFVLYKPKDIVAGDFYWMETAEVNNKQYVLIAAADSTGHGVPGAMVSVVCSNALNRAVKEFMLIDPGKILDKTRELVMDTFSKSENNVMDGMDISLCCFEKGSNKLSWAGANNPLWYIQNNELLELKPHKQPIGRTANPTPFPTHHLELSKQDEVFLITDGFADQFGGESGGGKKYKSKRLKEFLVKIKEFPLHQQQLALESEFTSWKGNLEQVDDITVIGFRI